MSRSLILWALCFLSALQGQSQVQYTGSEARNKFEGAAEIYINNPQDLPAYVKFESDKYMGVADLVASLPEKLRLGNDSRFVLINEEADDLGMTHFRYRQLYKNRAVEGSMLIIHSRQGKAESFNGEYYRIGQTGNGFGLEEVLALQNILSPQVRYAWQSDREENLKKQWENNAAATWFPKGELVIYPVISGPGVPNFRYAWKFDIYSLEPVDRQWVYVDAETGELIASQKILCEIDVNGKAITKYNGVQTIKVDSLGTTLFRLREMGRGGGIETYDNASGTDFTDNNNVWDSTTSKRQMVATDVHFGSEKTYDYYKNFHNRKSYDNNNAKLIGILQGNFVNAFWNGTYAAFGYGSGTWGPVTGMDVVGHEYTHGVTQKSSNLVYSGEPGALNESFSDIFGKLIENYAVPNTFTWYIGRYGAGANKGFRNMSNPNEFGCPDTYGGKYWNAGDIVHYNSSVQNFWFYLLSVGGSGKNDSNYTYYVDSIGMLNAGKVAYRNNTFYLTTNSKFQDARFYAIKSAEDIFGLCTKEIEAVTNAWYAVGVGKGYTTPAGKPKGTTIEPFNTRFCSADSVSSIDFKNPYNYGGIKYRWRFGDGDSSQVQHPTHVYKNYGIYQVVLRTEYCFKYYFDTTTLNFSQKPIVDFLVNHKDQCLARNNYIFTSTAYSKLKRKLTLTWDSNPFSLSGKDSVIQYKFSTATTYAVKLIATDDRGCTNEMTREITVMEIPKPDFSFKNACPGQTVVFTSSNLPDTSVFKYSLLWDLDEGDRATTPNANKSYGKSGVYKISLSTLSSNQSCTDTVSKWLTIYKSPVADFNYDSLCPGVKADFYKLKTNDSLSYFEWNFGIFKPFDKDTVEYVFPSAGQYSVSLKTVGKKCISSITKSITVNPGPVAQFTGHDACENEKQTFTNTSYVAKGNLVNFAWTFSDGSSSGQFEPEKSFVPYGNALITLKVTDTRGCMATSSLPLKIHALPLASFISGDICMGEAIQAQNSSSDPSGNPLAFKWYVGQVLKSQGRDLTLSSPGTGLYEILLEARSEKGCVSVYSKTVRVKPLPDASFQGLNSLYCVNERPIPMANTPGGKWFVNGGPMTGTFGFPQAGNFALKYVVTQNGCTDSSSQSTTVIEAPVFDLGAERRFCEEEEVLLDASQDHSSGYIWNTGENTPTLVIKKTGVYRVIVHHRCKELTDSVAVTYFGEECPWFIPNAFSPNDDGINDVFEIKGRVFETLELTVYNRLLQIIYQYKGPYKSWDGRLMNGEEIALGIYPTQLKLTGFNGEVFEEKGTLAVVK